MSLRLDTLDSHFGVLELARYPESSDRSLRAWDAADEYLLEHLAEQVLVDTDSMASADKRVLLVNDTYGSLVCALSGCLRRTFHWSDSLLSQVAVAANCERNDIDTLPEFIRSTVSPPGKFDVVVIKVPKTTALLEDQLIRLRAHLHSRSIVVAAGMVRYLNRSSLQCFEKYIGPVTTSLAKKKSRLIFAAVDSTLDSPVNPYPTTFTDADVGFPLFGHANVFCRDRLDAGARHFLSQFAKLPEAQAAIDLGCGNGVLGIAYKRVFPSAQVCFVDESFMAIESARDGYRHQFTAQPEGAKFLANDGLTGFANECTDLILCNPPFHQQHVRAEQLAHGMFADSKRCLRRNGELWVVANRHLPYKAILNQFFGNCSLVMPGPRFTLYRSRKT